MHIFNNPSWMNQFLNRSSSLQEIPDETIIQIGERINKIIDNQPIVTISIPVYNEELNIIRCLDSISKMRTKYNFDILIINNNSIDNTRKVLEMMNLRYVDQVIQGYGPARQKGLEEARGKYILTADADCIYPPTWVDSMMNELTKDMVVCVYGKYSFLSNDKFSRWHLFFYEFLKEKLSLIKNLKRPYLNCYGMNMGYRRDIALKIGYDLRNIRGEDGRLCFDLMNKGKICYVKTSRARVWTNNLSNLDDGLLGSILKRFIKELSKIFSYFFPEMPHDTKASKN